MTDPGPLESALDRSLLAAPAADRDAAAVALARHYARLIDSDTGGDIAYRVGPRYLAALSALGLTVAGRRGVAPDGGDTDVPARGKLDELRERRAARERARKH